MLSSFVWLKACGLVSVLLLTQPQRGPLPHSLLDGVDEPYWLGQGLYSTRSKNIRHIGSSVANQGNLAVLKCLRSCSKSVDFSLKCSEYVSSFIKWAPSANKAMAQFGSIRSQGITRMVYCICQAACA